MKILLVTIRHQIDSPSGSARIAHDESVALARRGHEVWVLAEAHRAESEEYEVDGEGRHLLRYRVGNLASWHPKRRTAHQEAAASVLKRHLPQVDVIHGHIPLAYRAALDVYPKKTMRKIYTVHSPVKMEMELVYESAGFLRRLTAGEAVSRLNQIEAECLRQSDVATALSQFTVDCLRNIHGAAIVDRVVIVPGWVNTRKFQLLSATDGEGARQKLGWTDGTPTFFTLRRFAPRMGLDRLIRAAGKLRDQKLDFRMVIAGDGPLRNTLKALVSELSLEQHVHIGGEVSEQDLPLMYGACEAFVLPTRSLECFGLIAIEALSAGRPVMATPVGAIPEVLRNFEPKWLARSAEAEDIAELLAKFLKGELPRHSPEELRTKTESLYSQEAVLGRFIEIVQGAGADAQGR